MGGRGGGSPGAKSAQSTSAPAAPTSSTPSAPSNSPADQIQNVYQQLASRFDNPFVILTEIRDALPNLTRGQQDNAFKDLLRSGKARLFPEENQKTLTDRDRAAGINISGEQKHLMWIQP